MPFLKIAGIEVDVVSLAEGAPILVGDEGRSFDGTLRGDIVAEKRQWSGTGLEISRAGYESLRSAIALGAHVTVEGDSIPGSPRTVRVRLSGGEYVVDGTGYLLIPAFSMEDV